MKLAAAAALALALALAGSGALACGGSSLPEPEPCVEPSPTSAAESDFARLVLYYRTVERGESELSSLLREFQLQYPDGKFYRSSRFREDWVAYSGAAGCVLGEIEGLELPAGATSEQKAREAELDVVVGEYRRVLERGTEAVRQRNTSDYHDFDRDVDKAAQHLRDWVDRGFN